MVSSFSQGHPRIRLRPVIQASFELSPHLQQMIFPSSVSPSHGFSAPLILSTFHTCCTSAEYAAGQGFICLSRVCFFQKWKPRLRDRQLVLGALTKDGQRTSKDQGPSRLAQGPSGFCTSVCLARRKAPIFQKYLHLLGPLAVVSHQDPPNKVSTTLLELLDST